MKKILSVFCIAFVLNLLWENAHAFLYESYKGGVITEFILMRASLFDACVTAIIAAPFMFNAFLRERTWGLLVVGTVIAIVNEWYGLGTGRWAYNAYMPIIPFIHTGLTPTIQLGLLGYVALKLQLFSKRDTMRV